MRNACMTAHRAAGMVCMLVSMVTATEPNYVETTVFQDENQTETKKIITREYSDGLGRSIQTQTRLNTAPSTTCLISATLYD
ncbi:MAG: hypothetical protein GF418_16850, partial [Chitinivibrionales bacterium]|nr:hypothetical protein [Chitinivibrionales bacterium]MBD3397290.1 hypothetical protein [Chitinivibrionales bacterium]